MLRRTLRGAALMAVLMIALSACDLTVRIGTSVEADGSGVFSLEMELDEELVQGLEQAATASADGTSSIATLEALFTDLAEKGWRTARRTPKGGLVLEASRPFGDPADFERALAELSRAGGGQDQPVDLGSLDLDFETRRSFLRTEATFDGRIDLGFGEDVDPIVEQLSDVLADAVHFEIRARLPGGMTVREGGGIQEGDEVVWRPRIGESTTFVAESSQLRTGSLLLIVVPAFVVLALIAWLVTGRKARRDDTPEEVEAITQEQPAIMAEVHHNGARAFAGDPREQHDDGDDGREQPVEPGL